MPKLPGIPLEQAQAPVTGYVPNNSVAGAINSVASDQSQQAALMAQNFANTAKVGAGIALQMQEAENKRQAQQDAIARSLARTRFYTQADELFNTSEPGLIEPGGLEKFQADLTALRGQTVGNFGGSAAGQQELDAHLADAVSDYSRAALGARSKQVAEQFSAELSMTENRLASKAYDAPTAIDSLFAQSDAVLADASTAMTPAELNTKRAEMHGLIGYSAVDGLLNKGQIGNAEALLTDLQSRKALPPNLYSALDRRLQEDKARAANTDEWKMGTDGILYKSNGETRIPPPDVQEWIKGVKTAGKTTVDQRVELGAQSEFNNKFVSEFADRLKTYNTQAQDARASLRSAKEIDTLLQGQPTGNIPSDVAFRLSQFFGVNPEQVANRQAADVESGKFTIKVLKNLYPVSDTDKKFADSMSPGSAQTPEGRKIVVYLLDRQTRFLDSLTKFTDEIGAAVFRKQMDAPEAQQRITAYERHLNKKYESTFNPPKFVPKKGTE